MKELESYTRLIEDAIQQLPFDAEPSGLYDPLKYFMQLGGKRIRPVLTLMGAQLFGADVKDALPQAIAIETFHNFTLIHDDIMDDAPLRRSQPTVHEKWNVNTGILSGDVLLIKAYQLLGDIAPELLGDAFKLFNETAVEVCEGQQMDMDFEQRSDVSVAEYLEMIRLKTSVLLGCALEIGAIVARAPKEDRAYIYNFGQHIGVAFQIQDDILDLYADPDKFGKQVGGDVIANKKTLLYLTALTQSTSEQREILKQLENASDLEMKVRRTKELFDHLNVRELCEERMQEHYKLAMDSLDRISVDNQVKDGLKQLANYLMNRDV